jgi:hypothetical protein
MSAQRYSVVIDLAQQQSDVVEKDIFASAADLCRTLQSAGKKAMHLEDLEPLYTSINLLAFDMVYNKGRYCAAQENTADLGHGTIHLYKDNEVVIGRPSDTNVLQSPSSTVVAVLAVPSYMTSADFYGFIGEPVQKQISHIRLIRTSSANRYMALLRFRRDLDALQFLTAFNGRAFNSMDPETAHCVHISAVSFSWQLGIERQRHGSVNFRP